MKQTLRITLLLISALIVNSLTNAQTYSDGPIQLRVKVGEVRVAYSGNNSSDFAIACGSFCNQLAPNLQDDELTFYFWAQDNANVSTLPWQGGFCLTDELAMSSGGPDITGDFDTTLFFTTYTGATVPQFVNIRQRSWEDDVPEDFSIISGLTACGRTSSGTRCTYESSVCCLNLFGCVFDEGDDYLCDANPYATNINYRQGPPCQTTSRGFIAGSGCSNNFYRPEIKTFWRYTRGTACSPTAAIDLGTISPGTSISHFNSNECYGNVFAGAPGNDVYYTFQINNPLGVTVRVTADCPGGTGTFNVQLNLLQNNCTVDSTRNGTCTNPAIISKALCATGRYYVVVDGATLADLGTFTLTVEDNPSFSLGATVVTEQVSCFGGSDGTIQVNATGGVPPYTYQWSGGLAPVDSTGGLPIGTFSVTVSDSEGCQTTATGTITQPVSIGATTTATNVSCGNASDGSATAIPSGGQAPYFYNWNSNPTQGAQTAQNLPAGTYTVTVTDFNGCTVTATATVAQTTTVVITPVSTTNITCFGANNGAISMDVTGGDAPYSYAWTSNPPATLPTTEDLTGLAPGTYNVVVTDNVGCTQSASFVVTEPSILSSSTNVRNASCQSSDDGAVGLSVIGGTSPYTYLWSDASTSEELFGALPGTYQVTITDANGCTVIDSDTVSGPADSIVSSIVKTDANCADSITGTATLTVSGGTAPYTYFWSNFAATQNVTGLIAGTYSVVITDGQGCVRIDTVTIAELAPGGSCGNGTVNDTSAYVAIPNAFSPNNDQVNDIFQFWLNKTTSVEVFIFNRFGSQVYYNANQADSDGWNGEHNGDPAIEGTYVYMVNIVYEDGAKEQKTGSITLIR